MKNTLIRIFGAFASAFIILGVFLPFTGVLNITKNLWQIYEASQSLYIPIIFIVLGTLGILLFSINKKNRISIYRFWSYAILFS